VSSTDATLLPNGREVPFANIEATLARLARNGRRRKGGAARALTATVVVVGDHDRLVDAAEALARLSEAEGVRAVLISQGDETAPAARVTEHAIGIAGLEPRFLNNAVAALRLSSLPTAVWWRGGSPDSLREIAHLADRLIIDLVDPAPAWSVVRAIAEESAVTDLRWTQITRWRALIAHLFDLPDVRRAPVRRLAIGGRDPFAARLFAGWLRSELHWGPEVAIDLRPSNAGDQRTPIDSVELEADGHRIAVKQRAGRGCLRAEIEGRGTSTRVVPLGEGSLTAIIGEELGVRTRDLAFERALAAALEIPAWQ
jgi:hypothetical protein